MVVHQGVAYRDDLVATSSLEKRPERIFRGLGEVIRHHGIRQDSARPRQPLSQPIRSETIGGIYEIRSAFVGSAAFGPLVPNNVAAGTQLLRRLHFSLWLEQEQ